MVEGPYVQDFGSNVCQVGFGLNVDQSYFVCGGEVLEEGESPRYVLHPFGRER